MCDSIEGATGANITASAIPASGVGLEAALANYAEWFEAPDTCLRVWTLITSAVRVTPT